MNDEELRDLYAGSLARLPGAASGSCPDPETLQSIAEGRAEPAMRLETMRHVAACLPCQRELALLGQVADTEPRPMRGIRTWAAAAAAAIVVIAAVGVLQLRSPAAPAFRGGDAQLRLLSPSGAVARPAATRLVWSSVPRAVRYEIEVMDADGAVVFQGNFPDTLAPMPEEVAAAGAYRWRVTAVRADGSQIGSLLGSFRIAPP